MNEEPKKQQLSTEPYKGVRDFYPEDMFVQNYIFSTMRETVEKFGYVEYNASVLEPTELYTSKTSEEIVNDQMFSFKDRGDRDVTLRPEMTPTVARMIAAKRRDISFPARWYSIPNVFRYEQPQRGRLREHWQLNVDLFGSDSIEADIEIITVAFTLMKAFGAKDSDFIIKINNRKLLQEKLGSLLISAELYPQALRLIDKKSKISKAEFEKEWKKLSNESFEINTEASSGINSIIARLENTGITNIEYDPIMVRGFDYYTGTVFEVFDTNPKNHRSLFGGGRYDNLTANFGGEPIPAIGFGMGDVTIRDFLETRDLLPKYVSSSDLFIATIGDVIPAAQKLALELRNNGVNVSVNITDKKIGDQIKMADKNKIPFVLVIGENELKNKSYVIKELASGNETNCSSVAEMVDVIL